MKSCQPHKNYGTNTPRISTTPTLEPLQATIPRLTRSALHRCFLRHGISRLLELDGHQPAKKKKFKRYPIGYFHIDLTEVRTEQG